LIISALGVAEKTYELDRNLGCNGGNF
jgi:hypothetical protein